MRVTLVSLFGKLVVGLAGIFLLFVFVGCEKERSVTGPTSSTTTEMFIDNAAMAQSKNSTSRTFSMDQYKYYTGDMYVSVYPGGQCKDVRERNGYATARLIWGPWQTKEGQVKLHSTKSVAIKFKKMQKDSVPLTVVVDGCDESIYYYINLYKGTPPNGYYIEYTPDWERR